MRIPSSAIPQADRLKDVVRAAEAVRQGARTYQEIADYIDKVDRQGRYYRLAAQLLGLIESERNYAELTPFGERFLEAEPQQREDLLAHAVLSARLFQRVVPFFEMHPDGVTRPQLEQFIDEVTQEVGPTMIHRRASTVLSWLQGIDVVRYVGGRYSIASEALEGVSAIQFDVSEPLAPKTGALEEYQSVQERTERAAPTIEVMKNQAAVDRANQAHSSLVNLVATRIRTAGALPRCNEIIDLATRVNNRPCIFEMKSMTQTNARSQVRHGLSQLYEYRYLQNLPGATLVLVTETPLPEDIGWMRDYLERDRQVRLVWDGDDSLYASDETQQDLSFLW